MRLARLVTQVSAVAAGTIVSLPDSPPAGAVVVDPSFPGVSFELNTFSLYAQSRYPGTWAGHIRH
jgi:hypothetical protein